MEGKTTRACVLHGIRDLQLESRQIAAPGSNEVQVSVRRTGICGSDQHYFQHFCNGDFLVKEPLVLGHESAGVVEEVGDAVTTLKVGDRVALEVGQPCGDADTCKSCSQGRYNLCGKMCFRSSAKIFPHIQGTLQERINAPAIWCYKLPDHVSLDEGALLEPFSVAIHAVRRARLRPGVRALVIGAGAVGLLVAAVLRVAKASSITIADIEAGRIRFATRHGFADEAVEVPRTRAKSNDIKDKLHHAKGVAELLTSLPRAKKADEKPLFDFVFECTGVEACVQAGIYATAPGGTLLMVGMGTPIQTLPVSAAALREVDLVGVFRYCNTYPYGLELLENKDKYSLPDISKLGTHHVKGLERVPEAFALAARPADDDGNLVIKVLIEF